MARAIAQFAAVSVVLAGLADTVLALDDTPAAPAGPSTPDTEQAEAFRQIVRHYMPLDGDKFIPLLRAGWFFNDTLGAYDYALKAGKPLVLVMVNRYAGYGQALVMDTLPCPAINRFAQYAIFAITEPGDEPTYDVAGKVLADALGVHGYPTISILEPDREKIVERARIEGFFAAPDLARSFEKHFAPETGGRLIGIAEAETLLEQSGLDRPQPPPRACHDSAAVTASTGDYAIPLETLKRLQR